VIYDLCLLYQFYRYIILHLFTFQTPIIYDNSAESRIIDI